MTSGRTRSDRRWQRDSLGGVHLLRATSHGQRGSPPPARFPFVSLPVFNGTLMDRRGPETGGLGILTSDSVRRAWRATVQARRGSGAVFVARSGTGPEVSHAFFVNRPPTCGGRGPARLPPRRGAGGFQLGAEAGAADDPVGQQVDPKMPWPEYPAPADGPRRLAQPQRHLGVPARRGGRCGAGGPEACPARSWCRIPVESALSGVMEHHDRLWYRRSFTVPAAWKGKQVMLNFGAVDFESEVYVNGKSVGVHHGRLSAVQLRHHAVSDGERAAGTDRPRL